MEPLKVLVLEDNQLVGEVLKETLSHLGHQPLLARSIDEARALASAHADVAVALVDAGLEAGEYGVDFLVWMAAHRPSVRRILISGMEPSPIGNSVVDGFLKKPFGLPELSSALTSR
jgi:DNA-binding NtrC family response regulator